MMSVKRVRKQIYKKCFVVFICLLVFGNLARGAVLCLGTDECASIELGPADCCHEFHGVPVQPSPNSCGQCVDIPIYAGLEKINRVTKQLNSSFPAPAANVIVLVNKFNLSAYNSASSVFEPTSYFAPLCTVILLI